MISKAASAREFPTLLAALAALVALPLAGCSDRDAAEPRPTGEIDDFPSVDALPERSELPDLFLSHGGTRRVLASDDFDTWRRAELLSLFSHYVYGTTPPTTVSIRVETTQRVEDMFGGKVTYEEVAIELAPAPFPRLHVGIFLPNGVEKPPVFLGPNKCGNHSLVDDERVRVSTSYALAACTPDGVPGRGAQKALWPVEEMTARGFAVVTFHESDADPDSAVEVHPSLKTAFDPPGAPATHWGTIAAWSWAVSRVVDVLVTRSDIDPERIAVVGHSRRGKAALWAGANDPRIAMTIAHQSGTAGAALFRSFAGESVASVNEAFPHWFNDVFPTFGDNERRLPIDQHELIALHAPRPVLITDGSSDAWADPKGARAATEAASAAWNLFGDAGLVNDAAGMPRRDASLVWASRPGGHAIDVADWDTFATFASLHFGVTP